MGNLRIWKLLFFLAFSLGFDAFLFAQVPNSGWRKEDSWFWENTQVNADHQGAVDAKFDLEGNTLVLQGMRHPLGQPIEGGVFLIDSSASGNTIMIDIDDNYYSAFDRCALSMNKKIWVARRDSSIHVLDYQGQVDRQFKIAYPVRAMVPDTLGNLFLVFGNNVGFGVAKFDTSRAIGWVQWYPISNNASQVMGRWGYDDKLYVNCGGTLLRIEPLSGNVSLAMNIGLGVEFAVGANGEIHIVRKSSAGSEIAKLDWQGNLLWARRIGYTPRPGSFGTTAEASFISVDALTGRIFVGNYYRSTQFNGWCNVYIDCPQLLWLEPTGIVRGEQKPFGVNKIGLNISGIWQGPRHGFLLYLNAEDNTCIWQYDDTGVTYGTYDQMLAYCTETCNGCPLPNAVNISWSPAMTSVASSPSTLTMTAITQSVVVDTVAPSRLCYICPSPSVSWTSQATQSLTHVFTQTVNNFNTLSWDFGDGTTSTSLNPTHTFPALGWYLVTLYATNPCGSDTLSQWVNACVFGQFSTPAPQCVGQAVTFQNTTSPAGLPTTWYVNGTQVGTGPQLTWAPPAQGAYTISMIVQNQSCTDTVFYTYSPSAANAVLPADTSICANTTMLVQETGGNWWNYLWSNGQNGSSIVAGPGTYWVRVWDPGGCPGSDTITISALPTPDAAFTRTTNGATVTFIPLHPFPGSYLWSFGDGTTDTTAQPTHTYSSSNLWTVCLRIYGNNGCSDSVCINVPVIVTGQEAAHPGLVYQVVPSSDQSQLDVHVHLPSPAASSFRLHDLAGRTLWTQTLQPAGDFDFNIPTQNIAAGCYLLTLEAGEARIVRRVLIR